MILNKFKGLLAILLLASTCLWAEPAGTSGKSSDSDQSRWSNFALFFGSWVGTTTGAVNKYLDVKMGFPFIIDFELQLPIHYTDSYLFRQKFSLHPDKKRYTDSRNKKPKFTEQSVNHLLTLYYNFYTEKTS